MNCPQCGEELDAGYVQSGGFLIWTPEKHRLLLNVRDRDVELIRKPLSITPPSKEAFRCGKCKFILIPYEPSNGGL